MSLDILEFFYKQEGFELAQVNNFTHMLNFFTQLFLIRLS